MIHLSGIRNYNLYIFESIFNIKTNTIHLLTWSKFQLQLFIFFSSKILVDKVKRPSHGKTYQMGYVIKSSSPNFKLSSQ